MAWTDTPLANWLRLIATIYLTSFALGYCVLRIFNGLKYLGHLSTFLLSFLLSIFLTSLLEFALLASHHSINQWGQLSLVIVNIALAAAASVRYNSTSETFFCFLFSGGFCCSSGSAVPLPRVARGWRVRVSRGSGFADLAAARGVACLGLPSMGTSVVCGCFLFCS